MVLLMAVLGNRGGFWGAWAGPACRRGLACDCAPTALSLGSPLLPPGPQFSRSAGTSVTPGH